MSKSRMDHVVSAAVSGHKTHSNVGICPGETEWHEGVSVLFVEVSDLREVRCIGFPKGMRVGVVNESGAPICCAGPLTTGYG